MMEELEMSEKSGELEAEKDTATALPSVVPMWWFQCSVSHNKIKLSHLRHLPDKDHRTNDVSTSFINPKIVLYLT